MNSHERIEAALRREEVDRIPLFEYGIDPAIAFEINKFPKYLIKFSGLVANLPPYLKNLFNSIIQKQGQEYVVKAAEKVGLDAIGFVTVPKFWWITKDEIRSEVGEILKYDFDKTFASGKFGGCTNYDIFGAIKTPEEFLNLRLKPEHEEGINTVEEISKKHPNIVIVPILLSFQPLLHVLGYDQIIDLMTNKPKTAEKMMEKVGDFNIQLSKLLIERGFNMFFWPEDLGSTRGLIYPLKGIRKIILPSVKKVVKFCHKKGSYVILHSCGDANEAIDGIIKAGLDALHPLEPPGMNFLYIKQQYGDKISLVGNIDVRKTLVSGTKDDVIEEVKERILMGNLEGHILSSSQAIGPSIKTQNFVTMVKAAKKYGNHEWLGAHKKSFPKIKKTKRKIKLEGLSWSKAIKLRKKGLINPVEIYLLSKKVKTKYIKGKIIIGTIGSMHTIGRAFINSCLKASGFEVLDIGGFITAELCIEKMKETGARMIAVSCVQTPSSTNELGDFIKKTKRALPETKIVVGGGALNRIFYDLEKSFGKEKAKKKILEMFGADDFDVDEIDVVGMCNKFFSESSSLRVY